MRLAGLRLHMARSRRLARLPRPEYLLSALPSAGLRLHMARSRRLEVQLDPPQPAAHPRRSHPTASPDLGHQNLLEALNTPLLEEAMTTSRLDFLRPIDPMPYDQRRYRP